MERTYSGSCHCGDVTYQADIDLQAGTGKCNCSICMKLRSWNALLKPHAFRLLSATSAMSEYRFGSMAGRYFFCRACGVHVFSRANIASLGGELVAVQLSTLDDAGSNELANAPVFIANGKDNDWTQPPSETRHL